MYAQWAAEDALADVINLRDKVGPGTSSREAGEAVPGPSRSGAPT